MHKLVTEEGWELNAQSLVHIGDQHYDMDELDAEQLSYVVAMLNVQGLNAAYAGKAAFWAEGLPPAEQLFPALCGPDKKLPPSCGFGLNQRFPKKEG